jgi:hypothetical protein
MVFLKPAYGKGAQGWGSPLGVPLIGANIYPKGARSALATFYD